MKRRGGHFTKYWEGGLILKFESRKWHLRRSENTFCKKLGFQNTVLMVRFVINHMPSHVQKHILLYYDDNYVI
jgi:hypothetical protein